LSRNGLQDASTWRCICGRQVPARMGECHCGVTRDQALAAAKADQPEPPKPLTLLGLSLRLGAAAAVVVLGVAVFLVYLPSAPPPIAVSPSPTPFAPSLPSPVASVEPAETLPPWSGDPPNWEPPPAPPVGIQTRAPAQPPETAPAGPDEPSDLEKLRARVEFWRGRHQSAAARIADLEKELAVLEADATRAGSVPNEDSNPGKSAEARRRTEFFKDRLTAARKELADARQELSEIEEGARAEGISPGQLY